MELPVPGERSLLAPAFRLIDRDLPASAEPHYQGLALHFQHSLAATATQRQPTPLPLGIPNFQGSFGVPSPTSCSNLGRRKAMRTCYPQPSVRGITPIFGNHPHSSVSLSGNRPHLSGLSFGTSALDILPIECPATTAIYQIHGTTP